MIDFTLYLGGIFFLIGGFSLGIYYANRDNRELYHFLHKFATLLDKPDRYEIMDLKHKIKGEIDSITVKKNKHFHIALIMLILGLFLYFMRLVVFYLAGI